MKVFLWAGGCWVMPLVLSIMFLMMTTGVTADWSAMALTPIIVATLVFEGLLFVGSVGVFLRQLKNLEVVHRASRVVALSVVQVATFAAVAFATVVAFKR